MFRLGKPRSKLGKWLDKRGISQEWVVKHSGVSRNTVSRCAKDKNYSPTLTTVKKLMKAIRQVDKKANPNDFFDI